MRSSGASLGTPTAGTGGIVARCAAVARDALRRPAPRADHGRAAGAEHPLVALAEPDPYIAFLIGLGLPGARVVEGIPAEGEERPDLVIAWVDRPETARLLADEDRPPVLGLVEGAHLSRAAVTPATEGLLVKPFTPAELFRAVRRALGMDEAPAAAAPAKPLGRARFWLDVARLAAVALAAVLELSSSAVRGERPAVLAAAFAYAIVRLAFRSTSRADALLDAGAAAAVLAVTGAAGSYMAFGLVACLAAGTVLGIGAGTAAGAGVATLSLAFALNRTPGVVSSGQEIVAWLGVFALAGTAGGLAARIWRREPEPRTSMLAEANAVLSALHRIARTMPGGLDIGTVASAAVDEMRDTLGAPAGALLLGEAGTHTVVDAFGGCSVDTSRLDGLFAGPARAVRAGAEPNGEPDALGGHDCWIVVPMRRGDVALGGLVAACPGHDRHGDAIAFLGRLADETAVAIDNARLFARVRELSADEERRRLARELHDGLAQALAHVRLELDFLYSQQVISEQALRSEVGRLSRVVDHALADVRSMVYGLRSSVAVEGLAGALRAYLRDLRGLGGPEISFRAAGDVAVGPEAASELFRIAQEAVSNALRHARAATIRVSLEAADGETRLAVEDDGIGLPAPRDGSRSGGVGLGAMRERARRIGARLTIGRVPAGGTRVEVRLPPATARGGERGSVVEA